MLYKLFLDETGDHSLRIIDKQYPIFVLVGCMFESGYYEKVVIPKMNKFKKKYFRSKNIVLHSYDIRKQKGPFRVLTSRKARKIFYRDLNKLIGELNFKLIATVILKKDLRKIKHKLKNISSDPYEICFEFILERFVMHLINCNGFGEMSFESRDDMSNSKLLYIYNDFKIKGSSKIDAAEIKKRILQISFPDKKANLNGHQIADLIAYPIARFILHPGKVNKLFSILLKKFVKGKDKRIKGYGLKIFPKKRFLPKKKRRPRKP